jgi:signal transduction histidine kinase
LRKQPPTRETLTEQTDIIGSEVQRVICLVEDLITTAALESGKLELRMAPMDLAAVAQRVVEGMRWQSDAKRQTIEFLPPAEDAGKMAGDAARLEQVIANLLSNAIKFSPPGETITVTLARKDRFVALTIRDRGAGISESDIPKLFAPFQRLATHPTASESSHGLGLSIAQEIAQRHGGQVRVDSQPGQGSTFTIELPVSAAPER